MGMGSNPVDQGESYICDKTHKLELQDSIPICRKFKSAEV